MQSRSIPQQWTAAMDAAHHAIDTYVAGLTPERISTCALPGLNSIGAVDASDMAALASCREQLSKHAWGAVQMQLQYVAEYRQHDLAHLQKVFNRHANAHPLLPDDAELGAEKISHETVAAGYTAFFRHLGLDPKAILAEKGQKI